MKFLVDAQLPPSLAQRLREAGHDTLHTIDLPQGNRTPDSTIAFMCTYEGRILITKDKDFVNSFTLTHQPSKLLLISTGNISNQALESLVLSHLAAITNALSLDDFVEVMRTAVVIHR